MSNPDSDSDSEMVWTTNRQSNVYHVHEDCKGLPDGYGTLRREIAEGWDSYRLCKICERRNGDGDVDDVDRGSTCSRCGSSGGQLTPRRKVDRLCTDCQDKVDRLPIEPVGHRRGGDS
jgi:hypothetical protein